MQIIHKLIGFGHEFCGSESDTLQESLKTQCSTYFARYHRQRLEDLKMHLENEAWAICPVRPTFQLSQLKVTKLTIKYRQDTEYQIPLNFVVQHSYVKIVW